MLTETLMQENYTLRSSKNRRTISNKTIRKVNSFSAIAKFSHHSNLPEVSAPTSETIYRLSYPDVEIEYISPEILKLTGYTPQEIIKYGIGNIILETRILGKNIGPIVSLKEVKSRRLASNETTWQADYVIKTKQGEIISVYDIAHPWRDKDGRVIGAVGSLRDVTERVKIENAIKAELVKLANTDPLTDLANRRFFFEQLETELNRYKRHKRELSLLILDIDYFKNINDTYGHHTGDQILIQIAKNIKSSLRETDMVARLGGEEFGIFLPDTELSGAYQVATRICNNLAAHSFEIENEVIKCTVSIGVSCSSLFNNISSVNLYQAADSRLYAAKSTGRNQVVSCDTAIFTK